MTNEDKERASLRIIVDDAKQPEVVRNLAKRKLQELDNAALAQNEPLPPAAAAPTSIDVTPRRVPTEAEARMREAQKAECQRWVEHLVVNVERYRADDERMRIEAGLPLSDIPLASPESESEQKKSDQRPMSEEAKTVLRKAGRELVAALKVQEERVFQSAVAGYDRGSTRPDRNEEQALKRIVRQAVYWYRTSGEVAREAEFADLLKKLKSYAEQYRADQIAAAQVDRFMDAVTSLHEAAATRKPPKSDGLDFDCDRLLHPAN